MLKSRLEIVFTDGTAVNVLCNAAIVLNMVEYTRYLYRYEINVDDLICIAS